MHKIHNIEYHGLCVVIINWIIYYSW